MNDGLFLNHVIMACATVITAEYEIITEAKSLLLWRKYITNHGDRPTQHYGLIYNYQTTKVGSDCLFYIDGEEILLKRRDLLIMNDRVIHGLRGRKTDTRNGKRIPRDTRISITFRKVK